ncbi:MAG: hypothetical protein GQF41_2609 [Candidatus Rifleibacterium amylolyticum]|jgi:hypothetical protein|nr:MAG: hypothetical protein GQF41_2609 [Candidatus Rifleibacterium amylolyticum]
MNKATFIQEIVPEKILYYVEMMLVVSKHVPC